MFADQSPGGYDHLSRACRCTCICRVHSSCASESCICAQWRADCGRCRAVASGPRQLRRRDHRAVREWTSEIQHAV